ncbi:MAG: Hsp20/alpha crystallin family protein [Planctomycetota bacterium]
MTATETKPINQACCGTDATCERPAVATKVFMPRADVYETKEHVELVADVPGVDEKTLDITLEKSVLTIRGKVESTAPAGYTVAYVEYDEGNYERAFKLADEIDRDSIKASIKNGVLRVTLTKAGPAKARKIDVLAN